MEALSVIDSIHAGSDTGYIGGTYRQRTIMPVMDTLNAGHTHDTVSVQGIFRSVWIRIPEYGWEIKKMETASR